jgi:hypothetical protein
MQKPKYRLRWTRRMTMMMEWLRSRMQSQPHQVPHDLVSEDGIPFLPPILQQRRARRQSQEVRYQNGGKSQQKGLASPS